MTATHHEEQTSHIGLVKRNTVSKMTCEFLLCGEALEKNHKLLELEGPVRCFIAALHGILHN